MKGLYMSMFQGSKQLSIRKSDFIRQIKGNNEGDDYPLYWLLVLNQTNNNCPWIAASKKVETSRLSHSGSESIPILTAKMWTICLPYDQVSFLLSRNCYCWSIEWQVASFLSSYFFAKYRNLQPQSSEGNAEPEDNSQCFGIIFCQQ